jgi:uncharacterized protein (TIGR03790 family)
MPVLTALLLLGALLLPARPVLAQSGENVLVVMNADSPASIEIGEYYAQKRAVPANQVLRLKAPVGETVSREDYLRLIELPVGAFLLHRGIQDQVLYIVLTKGIPVRIVGTGGRDGTVASVDSELTLLYRKLLGQTPPVVGRVDNPLFHGEKPVPDALPVTRFTSDIYLVTRLDGFTTADAKALVDRSLATSPTGAIVLDQKATAVDRGGDQWLETAADRLRAAAKTTPIVVERTRALASAEGPVLGYFSWGSNDPANQLRRFGLSFGPGAIGGMFVSSDGRTFVEPPQDWKPSPPVGGPVFRGSFQSLAGDLIRDGLTGVSAHVEEPYLDAIVRPQVLFPLYLAGLNLAEAYYRSMPYLGWQNLVIGDPLCRPFPGKVMAAAEIARPVDPETELPGLFSDRRLALASEGGLNPAALKLMLKKDAQVARGDASNVETLVTQAADIEPRLAGAHLFLAQIYESRKEYAKATDRYRRIVAVDPDDFVALNNLAYAIAVRENNPREALPHAERAYRLSKQLAVVGDTLGWIHHLLGDDRTASFYLEQAMRTLPNHPDILLHAAAVHLALGEVTRARTQLRTAERLGEAVTNRDDYKALVGRLTTP